MSQKTKDSKTAIILNIPADTKSKLDAITSKGTRTKFIISAIEKEIRRQELLSFMDDFFKSGKPIKITKPNRNDW